METISNYIQDPTFQSYITVVSLIITIISILLAVYFYKKQTQSSVLLHKGSDPIDIGKGLQQTFEGFQLYFKGKPLNGNIKYIRGTFVNDSKKDIKNFGSDKWVKLIIPESCEFLDVQPPKHPSLDITSKIDDDKKNIIIFNLPEVLKPQEYFKYEALYKDPTDSKLIFEFDTRIPDLKVDKDNKIEAPKNGILAHFRYSFLVVGIFSICFGFMKNDKSYFVIGIAFLISSIALFIYDLFVHFLYYLYNYISKKVQNFDK